MQIVVTGVAGFIGFHLACRLLRRGDRVVGIDDLNSYYAVKLKQDRLAALRKVGGDFHFHEVDLADDRALATALEGTSPDAIAHLGAQAGVRHSITNPHVYARSNLVGHLNMLEIGRQHEVRHLVYASSSSVYGGNTQLPFRVEDRVDHPVSLYAATKRADELMSESYAHLYRLPQTGLRFFTVYGPWGRPDMAVWIFTERILAGLPIALFNAGAMQRDFTFIDDIVAGVIAALDNPPPDDGQEKAGGSRSPHRLYNIGNSRPERIGDLVAEIERACDRTAIRELRPMQPGDVRETFADLGAISADLGYAPTTPISEGIPRFVDWYRSYHGC
jgi:UDP-glucuronate 4-epimerase